MIPEPYGLEVRPWPGGHSHGDEPPWCGAGYFSDYRKLFTRWAFTIEGRYHCFVWQDEEAGYWRWEMGTFSWTPDGDLFDAYHYGSNATRSFAERDARQAAESAHRQSLEFQREYEAREAKRRAGLPVT